MEEEPNINKKNMTEVERLKLAAKLDKDLDDYIAGLEKKSYTEGWPEDKWQEEFEKHPFFMTKSPEEGEELSPLMEGIQQLKYDSTENTSEELAATHKEDGNFNFKCKKYRLAVLGYTEGLRQKCSDIDLNAQLYNNRAAANFFLKNYRTSLADCLIALKLKPNYDKALIRAIQCYYNLEKYEEAIKYCDDLLKEDPKNQNVIKIKSDSLYKKKLAERDKRRETILEKKAKSDEVKLLKVIQDRGIQFVGKENGIQKISEIEHTFPEVVQRPVHLQNDRLVWPVLLIYPEYKTTDFIQEFHEDTKFEDQLLTVFEEHPEWDEKKEYIPGKLSVYFEDLNGSCHRVTVHSTLGEILSNKRYYVDGGTPSFMILVTDSKAEKNYLQGCS